MPSTTDLQHTILLGRLLHHWFPDTPCIIARLHYVRPVNMMNQNTSLVASRGELPLIHSELSEMKAIRNLAAHVIPDWWISLRAEKTHVPVRILIPVRSSTRVAC